MARQRFSIHSIVRGKPPLTHEQIADWWVKENVGAITEIALRSMGDPVGTAYELPPLRIVGFQTGDARILYQFKLNDEAKARRAKHVVEYSINQHVEDLCAFARDQLLMALSTWEVHATFQRDQFAYLNVREGK